MAGNVSDVTIVDFLLALRGNFMSLFYVIVSFILFHFISFDRVQIGQRCLVSRKFESRLVLTDYFDTVHKNTV
jgi:hypothetical protein